jgi:hypothetical protein
MLPTHRVPTHPGETFSEDFLKPLRLTQVALAEHLGVPVQRINALVRGKRGVTLRLLGSSPGHLGQHPTSGSTCSRRTTLP